MALVRACEVVTVAIAFFITASMIAGVFARFVLNRSLGWTEELSALLLGAMMFLIAGVGFHEGIHIGLTYLSERLPAGARRALDGAINVAAIVFFGVVGWYGYAVARSALSISLATLPWPRGAVLMAMPVACLIAVLVCLNNILHAVAGDAPKPAASGHPGSDA
jgi:TRAP-type C4-dicarboxylate transport system permease small subunit